MESLLLPLLFSFLLFISDVTLANNLLTKTQFLKDGDTIISRAGTFVMGFFSPNNSLNRYIGIWYNQNQIPVQTVVWVANRDTPLTNTSSAVLKITPGGQLTLVGDNDRAVWFANASRFVQNPVAELLNSGNFVVRDVDDENPDNFLWQSFDYPTDHYLSGMKLGWNLHTGHEVFLSAWKSENDPATGQFTENLDRTAYPELIIKNGTTKVFSSGPLRFSDQLFSHEYEVVITEEEVYFLSIFNVALLRVALSSNGLLKGWKWDDQVKEWEIFQAIPSDNCGTYGLCGGNAVCDTMEFQSCKCLDKFVPNNVTENSSSQRCHRRKPLNCHNDTFLKYSGIKMPDSQHSWYDESMSLQQCEEICLKNCSCMAYSPLNISNGKSGCLIWHGDLVDITTISNNNQNLYIRLAFSEGPKIEPIHSSSMGKKIKILVLFLSLLVVMVLIGLPFFWYFCKKRNNEQILKKELELPIFDWPAILRATNNFSEKNKLGQGGFGTVYKGALDGGPEIAVKRLSKKSKQGLEEFKNEVICIAKLQHRNLVKLLGCCISGKEKMLIYEYMPNKSLDFYIFDQTRKKLLDWPKRFNVINGIARGLLYLHQDSRLRIIHRDLKVSNILLDIDLNPKISDFGLARSIVGNATGDNTKRVAGTHGYMSPEYATHGIFSIKSDTFSFGVSILEIISGKRNNEFSNNDQYETLPGHAWKLYKEGKSITLVDEHITSESCDIAQVLRSIHVGLLCVQQSPDDRPNMSSVVQMLVNDVSLPQAKEPGFFIGKRAISEEYYASAPHTKSSHNEVTITTLDPR